MGKPTNKPKRVAAPKGTRDLYPPDALRSRYITQAWRDASIRCGFEEIAGPTFEQAELYAVKSGDEILGELFQAFSGKAPEELEQVKETGRAPYALRPEFTPTLARMYAARAKQLPKPCKWFTAGPYFRAERPQRGRLREFLQWNVDVIGLPGEGGGGKELTTESTESTEAKAWMDAECVECCACLISAMGFKFGVLADVMIRHNHREFAAFILRQMGVIPDQVPVALSVVDRATKMQSSAFVEAITKLGSSQEQADRLYNFLRRPFDPGSVQERLGISISTSDVPNDLNRFAEARRQNGTMEYSIADYSIVRGLAYYTGTVFEVIAEGERAVAGGGRYDNLIELMGGPPTPAVGFAMGDVVLGLLLEDKGLMPEGPELMEAVGRRPASIRPEVFVINGGNNEDAVGIDPIVRRLAADLRRGVEADAYLQRDERKPWQADRYEPASRGVRPLHARVSYKSTRNLKKLLGDAEKQYSKYAAIVHGPDRVDLRHLDQRKSLTPVDVPCLPRDIAEFSVDPASPVYIGRAVAALC